jgi:hypothetical protein
MKRLAAVVLLMAVVAGCGDDDGATSTATTASSTTTITDPSSTTSTPTTTTTATTDGTGAIQTPAHTAEDAARAVLTTAGTAKQACDDLVTSAFVAISYGSRKNCLAAHTPDALAASLDVVSSKKTEIGVHLVVVPDGGPYDGKKVEVEVLGAPDAFFVDSLQAHVPAGP